MKIIEPSVELINAPDYKTLLTTIEAAGRTCYKSEDKITDGSAEKFVRGIIKRGHEAVIEHGSLTVRFICDRGVSHEIVRHRLAAFCQESTRYCNYGKEGFGGEITVIRPCTFADTDSPLSYLEAVVRERRACLLRFVERRLYPAGSSICSTEQLENRGGHDR